MPKSRNPYARYVKRALNAPVHKIIEIKPKTNETAHDVRNNIAVIAQRTKGHGFISTKIRKDYFTGDTVLTCRLR